MIDEKELLMSNSKEQLVDMILRERAIHQKTLLDYIAFQKQVTAKMEQLTSFVQHWFTTLANH